MDVCLRFRSSPTILFQLSREARNWGLVRQRCMSAKCDYEWLEILAVHRGVLQRPQILPLESLWRRDLFAL